MSGPKSFRVKVTNEHLQRLFALQSDMSVLWNQLGQLSLRDDTRRIFADCATFLNGQRVAKETLQRPISIEYADELPPHLERLQEFIRRLETERQQFHVKQDDYQAFLTYEQRYAQSLQAFRQHQEQVIAYLQTYLRQDFPDVCEQAATQISSVAPKLQPSAFSWNFRTMLPQKTGEIAQRIEDAKAAINTIRGAVSNDVLRRTKKNLPQAAPALQFDATIQEMVRQIADYIRNVSDPAAQQSYQSQYDELLASDTRKQDAYFYRELLDDITIAEKTRQVKTAIRHALTELEQTPIHQGMTAAQLQFQQYCGKLLTAQKIKPHHIAEFQSKLTAFQQENAKKLHDEIACEQERLFIKAQIVSALRRLNYEVADDMQVIDFEKESEFVVKAPNQPNYLHLRFMEDGSFRYNFLIPEFKDDLSIAQIRVKIHEMETACHQFKAELQKLSNIGISIDLEKELPISEKAIIQIPQRLQEKIATQQKRTRTVRDMKSKTMQKR